MQSVEQEHRPETITCKKPILNLTISNSCHCLRCVNPQLLHFFPALNPLSKSYRAYSFQKQKACRESLGGEVRSEHLKAARTGIQELRAGWSGDVAQGILLSKLPVSSVRGLFGIGGTVDDINPALPILRSIP